MRKAKYLLFCILLSIFLLGCGTSEKNDLIADKDQISINFADREEQQNSSSSEKEEMPVKDNEDGEISQNGMIIVIPIAVIVIGAVFFVIKKRNIIGKGNDDMNASSFMKRKKLKTSAKADTDIREAVFDEDMVL